MQHVHDENQQKHKQDIGHSHLKHNPSSLKYLKLKLDFLPKNYY